MFPIKLDVTRKLDYIAGTECIYLLRSIAMNICRGHKYYYNLKTGVHDIAINHGLFLL